MDKIDKLKELAERAETLIGKKVRNGSLGSFLKIKDYFIVLTYAQADARSFSVMEEFKKTGFCVALRDEYESSSIPLLDTTELNQPDVKIKLTDEYDAIVSKDLVRVGCQRIPKAKIVELYNTIMAFQ